MENIVYAGSFDPFTIGHLSILKKANRLFPDRIIYLILAKNENKGERTFSLEDSKVLIEETLKEEGLNNVIVTFLKKNTYTVDLADELNAPILIRGLRNTKDYNEEEKLASKNKFLNSKIETIFLRTEEYNHIESSFVRGLMVVGGKDDKVKEMLPEPFCKFLQNKKLLK